MKKILIMTIALFAAQTSFAIMAFDAMPAFNYISIEVVEVGRDSINDANLLISGVRTRNNHNNEFVEVDLVLRDKLRIIEPLLKTGFTVDFRVPFDSSDSYDANSTYYVDESNPSDITITDNSNQKIAYTRNLSATRKGQSIPLVLGNENMIISGGDIVDCMEGTNKKVCHPEINIETVKNTEVLQRGDSLEAKIVNIDSFQLTDTHVYKQHGRDEQDYLRVQFLVTPSDIQKSARYSNNFYAKQSLFENPYCKIIFSESGEVVRSCGIRGWIYNLNKYVIAKINPEPDYGMIAC